MQTHDRVAADLEVTPPRPEPAERAQSTAGGWHAELHIRYTQRGKRTVLVDRAHRGPLALQKSLYPEGDAMCHNIVLHPPGGIVGGDELLIEAHLDANAHALLTTPGATKWYRSAGIPARQDLRFRMGPGAVLEWLPQETIVFDGAHARMHTEVVLDAGARYLGWEFTCLGRRASGEAFGSGSLRQVTEVRREHRSLWIERGSIVGGDPLLHSPVGLAGFAVAGTFVAAGSTAPAEIVAELRALRRTQEYLFAVTALPEVVIARYLGHSAEQARECFVEAWRVLRPWLVARPVQLPRIWRT